MSFIEWSTDRITGAGESFADFTRDVEYVGELSPRARAYAEREGRRMSDYLDREERRRNAYLDRQERLDRE
ncbi:MAG TPA: hypothetical protein VJH04_02770 [archaeon]|nr:hypothetical protein [archaeon]